MTDANKNQDKDKEPSARLDALKGYFTRLRDELVVRNHLAGMEVKDAVAGLAQELDKLSAKITKDLAESVASASDEARVQGHLGVLELKERIELLEGAVKKGLQGASKQPTFLAETARLHLALARMDAQQAIEERTKELRRDSQKLKGESAVMLKDLELKLEQIAAEAAKYV